MSTLIKTPTIEQATYTESNRVHLISKLEIIEKQRHKHNIATKPLEIR